MTHIERNTRAARAANEGRVASEGVNATLPRARCNHERALSVVVRTLEQQLPRAAYRPATRRPRVLRMSRRAARWRHAPAFPCTPRQRVRWTLQMGAICLLVAAASYSYVARLLEHHHAPVDDQTSTGSFAAPQV